MWYWKLIFIPFRVNPKIIVVSVAAVLALTAQVFIGDWLWLGLLYLLPTLYLERLSADPKFVAVAYARRHWITGALAVVVAATGGIFLLNGRSFALDQIEIQTILQLTAFFSIVGFVLGALLRQSFRRLAFLALIGRRRAGANINLWVTYTLTLVFFPWNQHRSASAYFLFGIALGIFFEKTTALRLGKAAAAYRRIQEIADAWRPRIDVPRAEMDALELLAKGRNISGNFSALRKFVNSARNTLHFTKGLALVSASAFRLEGEYEAAIEEARLAEGGQEAGVVDVHLSLLKVLSLEEIGNESEATIELKAIAMAKKAQECPIVTAIVARKEAEEVLHIHTDALAEVLQATSNSGPLATMSRALDLRLEVMRRRVVKDGKQSNLDHFLARFTEVGVPVEPSFFVAINAYCHLAAGRPDEARMYLRQCIELDPDFSTAYLYLGDTFLYRNSLLDRVLNPKSSDVWHARACYEAVLKVETNEGGRNRRLASARLDLLSQLGDKAASFEA